MTDKRKIKFSVKMVIFITVIVVLYAVVSVVSYQHMNKSLFAERSANTRMLMEKKSQNVETGIQNRWNTIHALAYQFSDMEFSTMAEAREEMQKMKSYRKEAITGLFALDENGMCYTARGRNFQWRNKEMLSSDVEEVYISGLEKQSVGDNTPRMFFMSRLPEPVVIDGVTLTHLCLSCEMDFVDPYFNTGEFGKGSMSFILQRDGKEIYRQKSEGPFAAVEDVRETMKQVEYDFGGSFEKMDQNIRDGVCDCFSIRYEGESYFVVFHAMETNAWVSLMLVPEANISSASEAFLQSAVLSIGLIALGGAAVLIAIILAGTYSVSQKKEQVNEQLRRAIEAERSANDAKTQFLSSMSHDIRTPMNAIIGMTTLASKHLEDTDYVRDCLAKVTLASNHLLTLINDVLDISKVETGKMNLNPIAFSLANTINNIVNIVRPQVSAKKQNFALRVHHIKEEHLFADELRLNQIFINILTNAVKYTPEGGSISVDLYQEASDIKNHVRLIYVVEDNGIGMSEEFQKEMYTSFTRASDEHIHAIQGTGLGLAICKQMVDLMHGTIDCISAPKAGTKFTVTLELSVAERTAEELTLPSMKLLLVDDDEVFLESAADMLRDMGLEPDCVTSGEAAIAAAMEKHEKGQDYPVVIIDWRMPGMDGVEIIRQLRTKVGEAVPIIVVSAYERAEIEIEAKEAGANGFLSKPFFRSTLYHSMKEILHLETDMPDKGEEKHRDFTGMRILVAEDNDLNWEIAEAILQMHGIKAERAENGQQCLDKLRDTPAGTFDLVLMDIQMPVMNGYEAAELIRSSTRRDLQDIPVIAMTADAFAEDIQRCMAAGMNGHLAKPINLDNLLNILEKFRGGG